MNSNKVRLNRYIASAGVCSRRAADLLIDQGKVLVNGSIAKKYCFVSDEDIVEVNGNNLKQENFVYIALNKPKGFLTACSDKRSKTVLDLVKIKERIFPLGRLDLETEGLLILSNDGSLFNKIMHPRAAIWKNYYVELDRDLSSVDILKIKSGVDVKKFEYTSLPAKINNVFGNRLNMEIREGKKREIRRIFSSLGYKVQYLNRVAVGEILLGDLPVGKYRYLEEDEIRYLKGL